MSEFINELGKENFIIISVVIGIIVLALIIIIFIEKFQMKARVKKQIRKQISNINNSSNDRVRRPRPEVNKPKVVREEPVKHVNSNINNQTKQKRNYSSNKEQLQYMRVQRQVNDTNSKPVNNNVCNRNVINQNNEVRPQKRVYQAQPSRVSRNNDVYNYNQDKINNDVVYVETKNKQRAEKEAKQKLEEVTKKLIDNNNLIDHTHFETEQEEKSIISYDELVKASHNIDEKNDKLLSDETEAAITLEELYRKHEEEQIKSEDNKSSVSNPVFEDDEPKRFKNSEVISPVFGFYSGKVKQDVNSSREAFKQINKNVESNELEEEIQKTEDFLTELRKLKDRLD